MSDPKPGIKIRRLTLRNFKGIDELELEFPPPTFAGDPDVMVVGSANGVGKTSVLEAIMLLVTAGTYVLHPDIQGGEQNLSDFIEVLQESLPQRSFRDYFVKSDADEAFVEGTFTAPSLGPRPLELTLHLRRKGPEAAHLDSTEKAVEDFRGFDRTISMAGMRSMLAFSVEPLIAPPLLYLHSNRRIQEGTPTISALTNGRGNGPRGANQTTIPQFKTAVIKALMAKSGLFEDMDESVATLADGKLRSFLQEFAEARLGKLRSLPDNSFDIMVSPASGGSAYSFDALSSGQKEIISTLFLIWTAAREREHLILIDEPELHLNAEWHRDFVRQIHVQAPGSQIMMATHSEDVFASVEPERRLVIQRSNSPAA